jgi:hypothetical protein
LNHRAWRHEPTRIVQLSRRQQFGEALRWLRPEKKSPKLACCRSWLRKGKRSGHLGEFEEARHVWGELNEINPNYAFVEHVSRQPFRREEDVERIADGLRKAQLLK